MAEPKKADLLTFATLPHDFYAILSLPTDPSPTSKQIHKAWRQANLKYHPDKAGADNLVAKEALHLATVARDVLCDEEARKIYEGAREARERKGRRERELDSKRRGMREKLEKGEMAGGNGGAGFRSSGVGFSAGGTGSPANGKRKWDGVSEDERRVQALAEEGFRLRMEREEKRRKENEESNSPQRNGMTAEKPASTAAGYSDSGVSTPVGKGEAKKPFGGFSGPGTPNGKGFTPGSKTAGSPGGKSLLEATLRKLKEAERRRSGILQPLESEGETVKKEGSGLKNESSTEQSVSS
ncbi:hypothetical protein MMC25_003395 [Agyrium rufum]|nr:hypothetical protein [Agyrium rufum]